MFNSPNSQANNRHPALLRQPVNAADVELSILAFNSVVTFSQTRAKTLPMPCSFHPR
jgi:hypothetical protein